LSCRHRLRNNEHSLSLYRWSRHTGLVSYTSPSYRNIREYVTNASASSTRHEKRDLTHSMRNRQLIVLAILWFRNTDHGQPANLVDNRHIR
jgi:hypothetical protein